MVRVVRQEFSGDFSPEVKYLLDQLAILLADHPTTISKLLEAYDVEIKGKPNGKILLQHVFQLLEKGGSDFRQDLTKLLQANISEASKEDSFVGAISGALGGVSSFLAAKQQAKAAKSQASSQTLQTMLAYKAQKEADAAAKEAAKSKQASQEKLLKMIGSGLAIGIVGWFLLKQLSRPKGPIRQTPVVTSLKN